MIKLIILNTCINFQLLGINSVTLEEAKRIQHMANTCRKAYKTCLSSVEVKTIKGGRHYNVKCR